MTTHFPTVPVDGALRAAKNSPSGPIHPLVLVTNEDPMITGSVAEILNIGGLAVLTSPSAHSALETARLMPPQLLITDALMDGMNGLDLAVQLTGTVSDCDVILIVGNSAIPGLRATMKTLNCKYRILFKPVHPADLLQAICELLVPRGHALSFPRHVRRETCYDLLTVVRPEPESLPAACHETRREHRGAHLTN